MNSLVRLSFVLAGAGFCAVVSASESTVSVMPLAMPTYPFSDPDPVPCTAERRYPYFRYDGSTDVCTTQAWTAVVLENEKVKVTLLPEVGGKVWGAEDKRTGRMFLYYNHAVKFRNIALRGPWCSGGIEFNFGILGHSPTTATPVDWTTRRNPDGSVSCFVSATEYVNRTTWQVEVNLPSDADYFLTRTTWYNGSHLPQPYYQWMTAAYTARQNPELLFPGSSYIGHQGDAHAWPIDDKGRDLHVYGNNAFGGSKSYHVLNGNPAFFGIWWPEAGFGSYHVGETKYGRKIWLWALSRAGGIWEDLLTDVDGQYVELQSGRVFHQPQGQTFMTPFKHPTFAPGATDTFEEKWGVLRTADAFAADCAPSNWVERPLTTPASFDWSSAYGLYRRGEQALRARDDRVAEQALNDCLAKEPCFAPALNALAELAIRHGRPDRARALCARALAVDTYDPAANYLDGFAARMLDDRPTAKERLTLAAFSPLYRASAEVQLAKLALRAGDWKVADEHARRALQAGNTNFDAWLVRLVCARKQGDQAAGREVLQLAQSVAPLFHGARYEAKLRGALDEAAFREAVRNELPEQTYQELGSWYEDAGLYTEAVELFGYAAAHPVAQIRRAHLLHRQGEAARAREALAAAAALSVDRVMPFRWESRAALAWAAQQGVSWKFAYLQAVQLAAFGEESEADRLLAACPDADAATFYLYRAKRRLGAERLQDLAAAQRVGDSWRVGRELLAYCLEEKDFQTAARLGEAYLKQFPKNNTLQFLYARALCGLERYDEAIAFLRGIHVLPSEYGENAHGIWQDAWAGVARLALRNGDSEKAEAALRQRNEYPENLGLGRPFPPER